MQNVLTQVSTARLEGTSRRRPINIQSSDSSPTYGRADLHQTYGKCAFRPGLHYDKAYRSSTQGKHLPEM